MCWYSGRHNSSCFPCIRRSRFRPDSGICVKPVGRHRSSHFDCAPLRGFTVYAEYCKSSMTCSCLCLCAAARYLLRYLILARARHVDPVRTTKLPLCKREGWRGRPAHSIWMFGLRAASVESVPCPLVSQSKYKFLLCCSPTLACDI